MRTGRKALSFALSLLLVCGLFLSQPIQIAAAEDLPKLETPIIKIDYELAMIIIVNPQSSTYSVNGELKNTGSSVWLNTVSLMPYLNDDIFGKAVEIFALGDGISYNDSDPAFVDIPELRNPPVPTEVVPVTSATSNDGAIKGLYGNIYISGPGISGTLSSLPNYADGTLSGLAPGSYTFRYFGDQSAKELPGKSGSVTILASCVRSVTPSDSLEIDLNGAPETLKVVLGTKEDQGVLVKDAHYAKVTLPFTILSFDPLNPRYEMSFYSVETELSLHPFYEGTGTISVEFFNSANLLIDTIEIDVTVVRKSGGQQKAEAPELSIDYANAAINIDNYSANNTYRVGIVKEGRYNEIANHDAGTVSIYGNYGHIRDGKYYFPSTYAGKAVYIDVKGNGTSTSDSDPVGVIMPEMRSAPVISLANVTNVTAAGGSDGAIAGLTDDLQVLYIGSESISPWVSVVDTGSGNYQDGTLSGLAAGLYQFRYPGTSASFPSHSTTIYISMAAQAGGKDLGDLMTLDLYGAGKNAGSIEVVLGFQNVGGILVPEASRAYLSIEWDDQVASAPVTFYSKGGSDSAIVPLFTETIPVYANRTGTGKIVIAFYYNSAHLSQYDVSIPFKVVDSTPPVVDNPSGNLGGGFGGGGGETTSGTGTGTTTVAPVEEVPKVQTFADATVEGALSALNAALEAAEANQKGVTMRLKNVDVVDEEVLDALLEEAEGKSITLNADSMSANGRSIEARLTVGITDKTGEVCLSASTTSAHAASVKRLFERTFVNDITVVSFGQKGSFGQTVKVAIQAPEDTSNLYFYTYDKETNKYKRVKTTYRVDKNGFLHFSVTMGNDLIISNGPLAKE